MTEKLPSGEAYKRAHKGPSIARASSKRLIALQKEWVADTQFTSDELREHMAQMREDFYVRHPEYRVNTA